MNNIQEAFDRINQIKKEQKNAKSAYKDALENSDNHRKISEEMKSLREKKKQVETIIKKELGDMYHTSGYNPDATPLTGKNLVKGTVIGILGGLTMPLWLPFLLLSKPKNMDEDKK